MPTDCISFRDTAYASKLICDYVENRSELQSLYNRYPTLENFKPQLNAKKAEFSIEKRAVLVSALTQQYASLMPSNLTTSRIQSLANQNTFTVTTGHQLNLTRRATVLLIQNYNNHKFSKGVSSGHTQK